MKGDEGKRTEDGQNRTATVTMRAAKNRAKTMGLRREGGMKTD